MFKNGNVIVSGLRGTGKDMLIGNVIARRRQPYISNVDYSAKKCVFLPLNLDLINLQNNFENLINGTILPYKYVYPEKADIYISDAGVYFPSQHFTKLNVRYEGLSMFQALSRQLGQCNFHVNTQNLNRVWDKMREQSDTYILCNWCKVFGKLVFQKVTIYERSDSCIQRLKPNRVHRPLIMKKELKMTYEMQHQEFLNKYGSIKCYLLIYFNKSKYDTRIFKKILKGDKNETTN